MAARKKTAIADLAAERKKRRGSKRAPPPGGSGDDGRRKITLTGGELPRVVDEAEAALIERGIAIYQRGSFVVFPVMTEISTAGGGRALAPRLARAMRARMVECFTLAARFTRWDKRSEAEVVVDCPERIAETYLARDGKWGIRTISGITTAPTLRADGSTLDVPGFDASGLLYDPGGQQFAAIPQSPTKDDAHRALQFLKALFATFPFVSAGDFSVVLSALLTALVRRSISAAPLHAITAPVAGSGKSLIVDLIAVIATGSLAPVISQAKDEAETEKRIASALLAGDQIIALDNWEHPLGGGLLCQALTQAFLKIRVLGVSANADVVSNATFFATGNNLVLSGDVTRRALLCSLDPLCERPELRRFAQDPLAIARNRRNEYVIAGLTVLRAHHVAGRPSPAETLGSFADWSSWVRGSLLWLGEADPVGTMEKTRSNDPRVAAMSALLDQWEFSVGERRTTLKAVISDAQADLYDVLKTIAFDGKEISARRLGKFLLANEGRILGGRRIVRAGLVAGIMTWRLELVERD